MSSSKATLDGQTSTGDSQSNTDPWEERWQQGRTGWDQNTAHPALVELLRAESELGEELGIPVKGKAIVPGCGRGYDVQLLASRGLNSIGVDIAATGVEAANKWLREQPSTSGSKGVKLGDAFSWPETESDYDVILDYTFLCALPPALRPKWSHTITSLSKPSPSTRLITLMFPLNGPPGGPPYNLSKEIYHELLDEEWELIRCWDVKEEWRRRIGPKGGEKVGVWARIVRS